MTLNRNLKELYPVRKCPVCDNSNGVLLFEQRFHGVDGSGLLEGYDIVTCERCGAVYSDHIPAVEKFAEYYANSSKYEFSHRGGEQHQEEINRVEGLAKWLSEYLPKNCSILDVGCATGELLLKLRDQGFIDITGLDPSRECVERARTLHGLQMIEGVLSAKSSEQRSFGAAVLSAVLEHIPSTGKFIEEISEWISPDGYLVVEVPDLEFFDRSRHAPFQELSVEHVNFFTATALKNLMGRFGFQPVAERHFICPAAPGGLTGAVVTVLFQKGISSEPPMKEEISKSSMEKYLAQGRTIMRTEENIIRNLVDSQEPILVWGTGTLCQRLLAQGELAKSNIAAFIDSNPHYQGKTLAGHPIIAPEEIAKNTNTILITSWGFQDEITAMIFEKLQLKNPVITFR